MHEKIYVLIKFSQTNTKIFYIFLLRKELFPLSCQCIFIAGYSGISFHPRISLGVMRLKQNHFLTDIALQTLPKFRKKLIMLLDWLLKLYNVKV